MRTFAHVVGSYVRWMFTADANPYTDPTLDIRDVTDVVPLPQQGWTALPDGTYEAPVIVPPEPPTRMSKLAFQSRYTVAEQVAIELAADGSTQGFTAEQRATLRVLDRALQNANDVDLVDPRTVQGVQTHVAMGLLSSARATEILDPAWTPA